MMPVTHGVRSRVVRYYFIAAVFILLLVILPSNPAVRTWLAAPLLVSVAETSARGDACYVLAGGAAIWERLGASADLLQAKQVSHIFLMRNDMVSPYSFKAQSSWTKSQWELDFLYCRGVPKAAVTLLDAHNGLFGTLSEARNVARSLPVNVNTLVVVSSPAHMRRVMLAFKRSLPAHVTIVPFAATCFENSVEMYSPLWLEYLKLFVYFLVA